MSSLESSSRRKSGLMTERAYSEDIDKVDSRLTGSFLSPGRRSPRTERKSDLQKLPRRCTASVAILSPRPQRRMTNNGKLRDRAEDHRQCRQCSASSHRSTEDTNDRSETNTFKTRLGIMKGIMKSIGLVSNRSSTYQWCWTDSNWAFIFSRYRRNRQRWRLSSSIWPSWFCRYSLEAKPLYNQRLENGRTPWRQELMRSARDHTTSSPKGVIQRGKVGEWEDAGERGVLPADREVVSVWDVEGWGTGERLWLLGMHG